MDELSELDPQECRDLLGTGGAGRVVFTEHALPAVVPADYVVWGDRIWFGVAGWPALVDHRNGAVLAFHVDRVDLERRTGWSVMALGTGRIVPGVAAPRAARALVEGAEPLMALDLLRLRGRVLGATRLVRAAS